SAPWAQGARGTAGAGGNRRDSSSWRYDKQGDAMKHRFLEITYRQGKPLAAYFYLPRESGDTSARTVRPKEGLLIDYTSDNRPIGVEITAPAKVTLAALNRTLASANQEPAAADEIAPLLAAQQKSSTRT